MSRTTRRRPSQRNWKAYTGRHGREINRQLRGGAAPSCPCCGEVLEAEPRTRIAQRLPLGATGYDLCCRGCRRFWCVIRHTERSLRLLRMRRLVAAVRAVQPGSPPEAPCPAVVASTAA